MRDLTVSGTAAEVRQKVDTYAGQGMTEVVYQPVGDIGRELERSAAAVAGQ